MIIGGTSLLGGTAIGSIFGALVLCVISFNFRTLDRAIDMLRLDEMTGAALTRVDEANAIGAEGPPDGDLGGENELVFVATDVGATMHGASGATPIIVDVKRIGTFLAFELLDIWL